MAGFVRNEAGALTDLDAVFQGDAIAGHGLKDVLHDADVA